MVPKQICTTQPKRRQTRKYHLRNVGFRISCFFLVNFLKKQWFSPWIFYSFFFWVNLPSKLKPNKKLPVCQAVDHCESCNPGYYVSGTSCKAFFSWLVGVPEFDNFHPWKVTETQKGKKVVFQCVPFLLKCCLEFLHQKTKPTFQKTCHLTVVQKRRPSALVQKKSWENIFH